MTAPTLCTDCPSHTELSRACPLICDQVNRPSEELQIACKKNALVHGSRAWLPVGLCRGGLLLEICTSSQEFLLLHTLVTSKPVAVAIHKRPAVLAIASLSDLASRSKAFPNVTIFSEGGHLVSRLLLEAKVPQCSGSISVAL